MIPRNREEYLQKHPEAAQIPPAMPPPPAAPKSIAAQAATTDINQTGQYVKNYQ